MILKSRGPQWLLVFFFGGFMSLSIIFAIGLICFVVGIVTQISIHSLDREEKPIGSLVFATDEDGDYLFLQLDSQESMIDIRTKPTVILRVDNRSFNEK